jgi:hypothetical protein
LSSTFITTAVDFLKVYLTRVPGAVTTIPGGFRKRSSVQNVFERMRRPFSKFASLPRPRRRSILIGSIAAAGISFVVGLIVVTGLELGVGKSLSCWVWDECSMQESSADGSETAQASTLSSVLGGGQSASSSIPQVEVSPSVPSVVSPSGPQQQPASQAGAVPGVQETPDPSPSAQPGQRQGPSGPVEAEQQQVPSGSAPAAEQQPRPTDEPEGH